MNYSWLIFLLLLVFVPFFRGAVFFLFLFIGLSILLAIASVIIGALFPKRPPPKNPRVSSRPSGDSALFNDEDVEDAEFKEKEK